MTSVIALRWTIIALGFFLTVCRARDTGMCPMVTYSKSYTYYLCKETTKRFQHAIEFCKTHVPGSNLVTFPDKSEWDILIDKLNATQDVSKFTFTPGLVQRKSFEDDFNPQTEEFYWVTNPKDTITNASASYWQPFAKWITGFKELSLLNQQQQHLLVTADGIVRPGQGYSSTFSNEQHIICQRAGSPSTGEVNKPAETVDWMLIAILAGAGAVLLIIIIIVIVCCVRKGRGHEKTKFTKVPQQDNSPTGV